MNIKNIVAGLVVILVGIWFYSALSSFKVEKGSDPKRIVIKEGVVRTESEVAKALADDMGFDLEGAYKSGYTSMHIVEYLIKEPHSYPVTFHQGRYYEGRKTVLHIIPFSVCIAIIVIGAGIILFKGKKRSPN